MAVHKINDKPTASKHTGLKNKEILDNIDYDKITLLGKRTVLFVWQDEVEEEIKAHGSILLIDKLSADRPRWGVVVKATADSELKVGEYILPVNTVESFGCVIDELEHWRTTDDLVQFVTDDLEAARSITD